MTIEKKLVIETGSGKIEGTLENRQYVFKGIPYAAPPVGKLRWCPPQPVKSWDGVRPAKEFAAISPQNPMPGGAVLEYLAVDGIQNEDCLYLNIWTPGFDDGKRPVMVWIHGGAFIFGSGSQKMFQSNTLVPRCDVVLVTINYRLGCFGFMNLKEITGGKIPATGYEGLLDQLAAIEWVRNNIKNFGGDPGNITLFGESAGAMSIGDLLSMPAAKGKFQKAILESGGANTVSSLKDSVDVTARFLAVLGLKGSDTEKLLSLDTDQLLFAQQQLGDMIIREEGRITPFIPVVDGNVLPEIPIDAIRKGSAAGIKTLAGTNIDEFKLFNAVNQSLWKLDDAAMIKLLEGFLPHEHVSMIVEAYRKSREQHGLKSEPLDVLTSIQSALMFRIPVINIVEAQCRNGQPACHYLFTWKSPRLMLGSCHALEIGFIFGNYDESFCGIGPDADELSRTMQDAWSAFAHTGDPSCASVGVWTPYGERRNTMIFNKKCCLESAPYEEERRAWDSIDMRLTKPI
jgi:para-nitrobenzyl esterase